MEIIKPSELYFDEYLEACKESYDNNITDWIPVEPDNFENWKCYALQLFEMLESGIGLPEGTPRMITYWCVEGDKFIGEFQIRPYLTEDEAKEIGHIGYAVRYSMWKKGCGSKILRAAVEQLHDFSVSPIYIACHVVNTASNKVAVKNGFQFVEKSRENQTGEEQNVYIIY